MMGRTLAATLSAEAVGWERHFLRPGVLPQTFSQWWTMGLLSRARPEFQSSISALTTSPKPSDRRRKVDGAALGFNAPCGSRFNQIGADACTTPIPPSDFSAALAAANAVLVGSTLSLVKYAEMRAPSERGASLLRF